MYSQTAERKYQLFPRDKLQPAPASSKGIDPEQAYVLAMGNEADKSATASNAGPGGLRLRIKEHNLTRRRKVSVPELGPMTTVQEVAMDSPTIPGRPPLHERSISAPGNNWKQHHLVDCMIPQTYDEAPELLAAARGFENLEALPRCSSAQAVLSPSASSNIANNIHRLNSQANTSLRQPLSPSKQLAPLVIPPPHLSSVASRPSNNNGTPSSAQSTSSSSSSHGHLRSGSLSAGHRTEESPRNRTPFTPLSAVSTGSAVSSVSAASTLPTPLSAAIPRSTLIDSKDLSSLLLTPPKKTAASSDFESSAFTSSTSASASATTPTSAESTPKQRVLAAGHRRGQSESGSIMNRGKPKKKTREGAATSLGLVSSAAVMGGALTSAPFTPWTGESTSTLTASPSSTATVTPATATTSATASATASGGMLKRSASKASRHADRRAFELLPRGCKASEALNVMGVQEASALAAQALQQAARFEVLRRDDVENLSRELRNLDERTEYLRRTYTSLRAGRRNLHARICQYLRSPRVARFSHDSMLRQEEALAELDASIDDWVTKLEQAENRRTRVRQKLLEHVAAAVTLAVSSTAGVSVSASASSAASVAAAAMAASATPSSSSSSTTSSAYAYTSTSPSSVVGVSETLQLAMGIVKTTTGAVHVGNISTPPRSPTKMSFPVSVSAAPRSTSSPSPQRLAGAQVPSTILEQPLVEEAMASMGTETAETMETNEVDEKRSRSRDSGNSIESTSSNETSTTIATAVLDEAPGGTSLLSSASPPSSRRVDVESIRIYAGDDVYALLADVESHITHMGSGSGGQDVPSDGDSLALYHDTPKSNLHVPEATSLSDEQRRALYRAHSHERLFGASSSSSSSSSSSESSSESSSHGSGSVSPANEHGEILLTSAVFRPERGVLAN